MADYYALRRIESEHIERLVRRFSISESETDSIERWWQRRVHDRLASRIDSISADGRDEIIRWMTRRSRTRRFDRPQSRATLKVLTAIDQVKFNTIGPGGRCWIGNRYVTVRRYTFRLHWRP